MPCSSPYVVPSLRLQVAGWLIAALAGHAAQGLPFGDIWPEIPAPAGSLPEVARCMHQAANLLDQGRVGPGTRQLQASAVRQLDILIAAVDRERAASQASSLSTASPQKPLSDSLPTSGPGGSGPMAAVPQEGKDWARLPPKQRERILQSLSEGFPDDYRNVLEKYYRRLAEESLATPKQDR